MNHQHNKALKENKVFIGQSVHFMLIFKARNGKISVIWHCFFCNKTQSQFCPSSTQRAVFSWQ